MADARRALATLRELGSSVTSVTFVTGGSLLEISRRDLHARVFGGQRTAQECGEVISLLIQH